MEWQAFLLLLFIWFGLGLGLGLELDSPLLFALILGI